MSNAKTSLHWTPPPRPEWLAQVNTEGGYMGAADLVPLDSAELIATAKRISGFDDFGSDEWREPFEVLIRSINAEAELNLFGRLMTRNDILLWLQARLGVEAAYREHPEIDDEVIEAPVFVTGLPRSGTSILFEILGQDPQFGSARNWEIMFPYPPPERATYDTDPRIERCEHLVTQLYRVAPAYRAMHEMGANIPNECILAYACTFLSEYIAVLFQVPSYYQYLAQADMTPTYCYYKRLLKMLQWKNPRRHWLLKAPSHLGYLPVIFDVFPDARVVQTHRDPIKAFAFSTDLIGTFYWMRSDKPFDASAFENLLTFEAVAARLNQVIDWAEHKRIPAAQMFNYHYATLIEQPLQGIHELYRQAGLELSDSAAQRMRDYIAHKPQGKFGKHHYELGEQQQIAQARRYFQAYQAHYGVVDEV